MSDQINRRREREAMPEGNDRFDRHEPAENAGEWWAAAAEAEDAARRECEAEIALNAHYGIGDDGVLHLTAEMMVSAHLQPNFVRPSAARPPKQRWANWVKGWKPLSAQGKAAKRYSRAKPTLDHRGLASQAHEYECWLEKQPHITRETLRSRAYPIVRDAEA